MVSNEESDGFKFAVTLLAAFGTIVSAAYIYFQNNAVSIKYFGSFAALFSPILMLVSFLLLYVFIKGASMELQENPELKKITDRFAAFIYSVAFLMFLLLFPIIVVTVFLLIIGIERTSFMSTILYILGVIFSIIFGWPNIVYIREYIIESFKKFIQLNKMKEIEGLRTLFGCVIAVVILFMSVIFWLPFLSMTLDSPLLQGDVKINMDNTYYKNGTPIPVSIDVTGRNPGLLIYLYNASSEIDNITLIAADNSNIMKSGKNSTLVGNAFDSGKYYVFINTSDPNMTEGYYKLVYSRIDTGLGGYKYGKSFYLSNDSGR
jgi:hypothetical protein